MNNRNRPQAAQRLTDALLQELDATFTGWHSQEPKLLFANRMRCEDPKTGLSEFGPAALDSTPRSSIRVAIVGSGETIQLIHNWSDQARNKIRSGLNSRGKPFDPMVAPQFPGFDIESPFRCNLEFDPRHSITLTQKEILGICGQVLFTDRVKFAVDLVTSKLGVLSDREPIPDIVVLAMQKELEDSIGPSARAKAPRSKRPTRLQKKEQKRLELDRKSGQKHFSFDEEEVTPDATKDETPFRDFHNSIKAHAMRYKLPTQLVWASTLTGGRSK